MDLPLIRHSPTVSPAKRGTAMNACKRSVTPGSAGGLAFGSREGCLRFLLAAKDFQPDVVVAAQQVGAVGCLRVVQQGKGGVAGEKEFLVGVFGQRTSVQLFDPHDRQLREFACEVAA